MVSTNQVSQLTAESLLEAARAIIQAAEYCFLITRSESGQANARLMQHFKPSIDLTLWFGTHTRSRKVQDISRDSRVTAALEAPREAAYLTLQGSAQVVSDLSMRRRYWREDWVAFFPEGPEGEDYALIKLVPAGIEIVSFAHHITPEPYGLQPALLIKTGEGWGIADVKQSGL